VHLKFLSESKKGGGGRLHSSLSVSADDISAPRAVARGRRLGLLFRERTSKREKRKLHFSQQNQNGRWGNYIGGFSAELKRRRGS